MNDLTGQIISMYPYIRVNYNDLTVLPHWKSWFILGKSSSNGRTIQVSERLQFTQSNFMGYGELYIYISENSG